MAGKIVIAGASGGIGRRAAEAFEQAGWEVVRYRRGTDLAEVARGADVIFNGLNPPAYHNWKVEIPRITRLVIDAARATGATILLPGTVYVYGDQPGPWTEATPHRPNTRKGAIRAAMERDYRDAANEGVRTIILRAGDFIDAENPKTVLNMVVLKGAASGRVTAMGDPDARRTYANLPDLARAMVALAEMRDRLAPFTEIGFPGFRLSWDEMAAILSARSRRPFRLGRFPWWAMRLASPFWEMARELGEMRYLYSLDHAIDGALFHRLLPDFRQASAEAVIAAHLPASGASLRTAVA